MLLPKPQKRDKKADKAFQLAIIKLDGQCMNPWCPHTGFGELSAHHIIYKSRGGQNVPGNGIAFCQECNTWVHNGTKVDGVWMSGDQYMLKILREIKFMTPRLYRWAEPEEYLIKKT